MDPAAIEPGLSGAAERLSEDDRATAAEEHFRAAALRQQRLRAEAAAQASRPGVCANCQAACLPQAIYCDDECRADHERRRRVLARQGRVG